MANLPSSTTGWLTRLRRDVRGNVLAMSAAAVVPMIGLVGGAVDMGRLYAVKSRLQSACDAGALAGRRVMGTGQWSDNSNRANTVAQQAFDLNFQSGSFGSENRARSFTESDGTVTGTASADVPMTLMRVFGMTQKSIAVSCEGQMRIPNTDVMFVLDNSGSMANAIPGDSTGLTKIQGLRTAIRCFYEALAKENLSSVAPAACGTTTDPVGGLSSQVQLRFGFVNYDHKVNVGKLLPNDFLVDHWTYQSREPHYATVRAWTLGSKSAISWGSPSPSSTPSSYENTSNYNGFSGAGTSGNTTVGGVSRANKNTTASNSTQCSNLNTYPGGQLIGVNEGTSIGSTSSTPSDNNPPVDPATVQNIDDSRSDTITVTGYRYRWFKQGNTNACWLEKATAKNTYQKAYTGTSSKPITWTDYQTIDYWTYKPVELDVSSLKAGTSDWNGSVLLPIGQSNGASVKLSGSNTSTTIKLLANTSVTWEGCIEERDTFQNTDGDGSDDWINFPTSPTGAYDMDIDGVPSTSDDRTRWRPALLGAIWGRRDTLTGTSWSGSNTTDPVSGGYTNTRNLGSFTNCGVTPSRKLTNYNGRDGHPSASDFDTYVGTINDNGNTYHDIGLLWGARLMSPTGIFASENATTSGGAQIARHMIFMTDGDTANSNTNYDSYGIPWWDRRQFDTAASNSQLEANNNARSAALCTAIKNKNITLWVISYGDAVNTTTQNRLRACATSPDYFFSAANTTLLIQKFREIADKISNLRLTQ